MLAGTLCDPNPCEPNAIPHACCFGDGSCRLLLQDACIAEGGLPQGACTTCDNTPCAQPMACCFPDGHCVLLLEDACSAQGGTSYGTLYCQPNPCPQPEACCYPDGHCVMVLSAACRQAGGDPQGSGTDCDPNPCPGSPGLLLHDGHLPDPDARGLLACRRNAGGSGRRVRSESVRVSGRAACLLSGGSDLSDPLGRRVRPHRRIAAPGRDDLRSESLHGCSPIPHACCYNDGRCVLALNDECTQLGGLPLGACVACDPNPCTGGTTAPAASRTERAWSWTTPPATRWRGLLR